MEHLNSLPASEQRSLNRYNFGLDHTVQEYPADKRDDIRQALMEAWVCYPVSMRRRRQRSEEGTIAAGSAIGSRAKCELRTSTVSWLIFHKSSDESTCAPGGIMGAHGTHVAISSKGLVKSAYF